MAGKLGNDFNIGQPSDDDLVKNGAGWIRDVKARLKSFLGVLFNLETGDFQDNVIAKEKLRDLSPSPAGTWVQVNVNSKGLVTGGTPGAVSSAFVPTGAVIWYPVATVPDGYLVCNGAAVSRITYATLFSLIGVVFGAGDGNTTFNLPNLGGRFLLGALSGYYSVGDQGGEKNHILTVQELPPHHHAVGIEDGPANLGLVPPGYTGGTPLTPFQTQDTGGGVGHNNMPPYQAGNWLIKT